MHLYKYPTPHQKFNDILTYVFIFLATTKLEYHSVAILLLCIIDVYLVLSVVSLLVKVTHNKLDKYHKRWPEIYNWLQNCRRKPFNYITL